MERKRIKKALRPNVQLQRKMGRVEGKAGVCTPPRAQGREGGKEGGKEGGRKRMKEQPDCIRKI